MRGHELAVAVDGGTLVGWVVGEGPSVLALHVGITMPQRLLGVLCVDPLGGVGDGGAAAFEAEIFARTPADVRDRATELDKRAMLGEGTEADAQESLRLVWPAYFPDWDSAPPMPEIAISVDPDADRCRRPCHRRRDPVRLARGG